MGDGTLGGMEAVLSVIHQDGSQRISSVQRGDCICETAMAMACAARVFDNDEYATGKDDQYYGDYDFSYLQMRFQTAF